MVDNPEVIAAALLTTLTNGTSSFPWATPPSRAAKIWGKVNPADQPCMFLIGGGGAIGKPVGYGVAKSILHYSVLIYMLADKSTGAIPETQLNAAWTAILNAMLPNMPGNRQTLGIPTIID